MKKRISLFLLCVFLSFLSVSCSTKKKSVYTPPPQSVSPPSFSIFDTPKLEIDFEALDKIYNDLEKASKFVVTYSARLSSNNHVGNNWSHGLKYKDEYIESGATIKSTAQNSLSVTAFAREKDTYSDYGSTKVTFESLDIGEKQSKEIKVTVRENRGRYSGNTAKWAFTITVERIS